MTDRIVKAGVTGGIFALVTSIMCSLLMTSLLYFELVGSVTNSRILYGAFVVILLMTSFIVARMVGLRGLLIGIVISAIIILLSTMYRFIGVESGIGFTFLTRSVITALVACIGAVIGVNTSKQ